jgi:plastocyanin
MRRLLVVVSAAAILAVAASAAIAAVPHRSVTVGDDYFVRPGKPPRITVAKGTKVTWHWVGQNVHNVAVVKGPVRFSSAFKTGGSYSKRLTKRGTYKLRCDVHRKKMKMTIVVG